MAGTRIRNKSGKSLKCVEISENACSLEYKETVYQDLLQPNITIKKTEVHSSIISALYAMIKETMSRGQ
jgi:hypothetical protein